jgi:hypothetical protein
VLRLLKHVKERHVHEVDADDRGRVAPPHVLGDHASEITTQDGEARIAELFDHQFVQQVCEVKGQSLRLRPVRKTVAGKAGDDDVKRRLELVCAMCRRLG